MTMKNGLKNSKKADLDKDGKLSGYEKKRGLAVEKAMGAKKGKMFRNGGNVLVPFIDYKSIAGMGRTKPKKKKEEIKEKNEKVSAIVPKPKPYTLTDLSETKPKSEVPSSGAPKPKLRPFNPTDEAALSAELTRQGDVKPPTMPRTTGAGDTSSIMKQKGTEGRKAKRFRIFKQNRKMLKDTAANRRQRIYEDKIATADFFGSIFGADSKRKSLADVLTGKKQGGLGVKMAKGGFKKKTPIY
tara:strand:- start:153 stop:878 length:726 start_codon:yes stop_codon:yes gene_type:complete